MTTEQANQLEAIYYNLGNVIIEKPNYTLDMTITKAGTDTTSTFIYITFNYSNISGYNKLYKPYKTVGYSGPVGDVIGYKKDGTSNTIASYTSEGIYDISDYISIEFLYSVRARTDDMYSAIPMPYLFSE